MSTHDIKLLGWLTLVWLTFCLGIFVLVLSGLNISDDGMALLKDGIPNWLQGLGTVAAAGLAFRALQTWREQEDYRRRSALAERILREVDQYMSSLDWLVKYRAYGEPLEVAVIEMFCDDFDARDKEATKISGPLRLHSRSTRAVLGERIVFAIEDLLAFQGLYRFRVGKLRRLTVEIKNSADVLVVGEMMIEARELLWSLGVDPVRKTSDVRSERYTRLGERELKRTYDTLEAQLVEAMEARGREDAF